MMDHKIARIHITEGFVKDFHRVPTTHEAQVSQGIGYLESRYGEAWQNAGKGSRNWGAVQKCKPPCPADSFLYTDSNPNSDGTSTTYSICFKKYERDADATADLIRIALGTAENPKDALEPARRGDIYGVSAAMYKQRYYAGFGATVAQRIENHYRALSNAIRAQCNALNEPFPDGKPTLAAQVGKVVGMVTPVKAPRNLQRGMRGEDVRAWQMTLNQVSGGFGPLVTDGMFGLETRELTMIWQHAHKLVPDGIVGPKTRAAATAVLKQAT